MNKKWSIADIGPQKGKRILITGGTSGIGLSAARVLAAAGAEVILAADDEIKGQKVIREMRQEDTNFNVQFERLDLSDLKDTARFGSYFRQKYLRLDVLINNAGLDAIPERMVSRDGHELIFATNYLGHFALTAHLFPMLKEAGDARIISVSSLEHKSGQIDFSDLEELTDYNSQKAYRQSKLALLMFSLELACKCQASGLKIKSIPVHPGLARTHIFDRGPSLANQYYHPLPLMWRMAMKAFGQSPENGALPILFAATSDQVVSGKYYGPGGPGELRGGPAPAQVSFKALNMTVAKNLWDFSEDVTGVDFPLVELPEGRRSAIH